MFFSHFFFPISQPAINSEVWASPRSSAILGTLWSRILASQGIRLPITKIRLISKVTQCATFQILDWKEQILHLILANRQERIGNKNFSFTRSIYIEIGKRSELWDFKSSVVAWQMSIVLRHHNRRLIKFRNEEHDEIMCDVLWKK